MSRRLIAVSLLSTFVLAGCGAQKAGLVDAPARLGTQKAGTLIGHNGGALMGNNGASIISNNASRVAPTVGVIRGEAPVAGSNLVSTLRVVGHAQMTDAELKADATSQGYVLQAVSESYEETGVVRKVDGGFVLEMERTGWFSEGAKWDVKLIPGTTAMTAKLNERVNKKTAISGVGAEDGPVTVTAVDSKLDFSFLTNWLTKGKIVGTVTNSADDKPLPGAKVTVKSAEGYLFFATTDKDGEFAVKTLEPGDYTVSIAKDGFQGVAAAAPETVAKRDKVTFTGELAPLP